MKFVSIKTVGKFFGTGAVMLALTAHAELSLPGVFGDNMVLQREQAVPVWGWAAPGEKVTVRFAWHETAEPNLFNQEGLPASPCRTDGPGVVGNF